MHRNPKDRLQIGLKAASVRTFYFSSRGEVEECQSSPPPPAIDHLPASVASASRPLTAAIRAAESPGPWGAALSLNPGTVPESTVPALSAHWGGGGLHTHTHTQFMYRCAGNDKANDGPLKVVANGTKKEKKKNGFALWKRQRKK